MTRYHVHLYREMRVTFRDVEAATPEEAAEIARGKPTHRADEIEDCDGTDLAALVDVVGDEEYRQSRFFDYTVRPAASKEES